MPTQMRTYVYKVSYIRDRSGCCSNRIFSSRFEDDFSLNINSVRCSTKLVSATFQFLTYYTLSLKLKFRRRNACLNLIEKHEFISIRSARVDLIFSTGHLGKLHKASLRRSLGRKVESKLTVESFAKERDRSGTHPVYIT